MAARNLQQQCPFATCKYSGSFVIWSFNVMPKLDLFSDSVINLVVIYFHLNPYYWYINGNETVIQVE